jgi:fibronectin type 3 domain-containing protein
LKGNSKSARLVGIALLLLICIVLSFRGHFGSSTAHSAKLSWKPSASFVKGYNIYRATKAGGPYTRLNPADHPSTSYVDAQVVAGATYYYVTTAVGGSGLESSYSNEVLAVIPKDKH